MWIMTCWPIYYSECQIYKWILDISRSKKKNMYHILKKKHLRKHFFRELIHFGMLNNFTVIQQKGFWGIGCHCDVRHMYPRD